MWVCNGATSRIRRGFTRLTPLTRSRLNTVYMFCYFVGGTVGSSAGPVLLAAYLWTSVCAFAVAVLGCALGVAPPIPETKPIRASSRLRRL
jgi:hypothetical protein